MPDFTKDVLRGVPVTWDTFLDTAPCESDASTARVVIIPIPYDSTTSYKTGAREGPRAIIEASKHIEDYDLELDRDISLVGIHTLPALTPNVDSPKATVQQISKVVGSVASAGKLPVILGGEHTVAIGAVQAMAKIYPDLSVLYFDAHADLRDEYMGSRWGHASVARRIHDFCPIVEVGVRSLSIEERHFIRDSDILVFFREPFVEDSSSQIDATLAGLTDHIYISVDLDVLDPSIMPAVGTPEPGGMDWLELTGFIRRVASQKKLVGFDISELSPREGPEASAYVAAKLAYKMIGYATSE